MLRLGIVFTTSPNISRIKVRKSNFPTWSEHMRNYGTVLSFFAQEVGRQPLLRQPLNTDSKPFLRDLPLVQSCRPLTGHVMCGCSMHVAERSKHRNLLPGVSHTHTPPNGSTSISTSDSALAILSWIREKSPSLPPKPTSRTRMRSCSIS